MGKAKSKQISDKRQGDLRKDLRKFREASGFSLNALAKISNLSRSMISKFELGQRDLSPDAAERLRDALHKGMGARAMIYAAKSSIEDPEYKKKYQQFLQIADRSIKIEETFRGLLKLADKIQVQRAALIKALEILTKGLPDSILNEWLDAEKAASAAYERIQAVHWNFLSEEGKRLMNELFAESPFFKDEEFRKQKTGEES